MKGRGKREIPEKTRRPTASSGTIPKCENRVTLHGLNQDRLGGRDVLVVRLLAPHQDKQASVPSGAAPGFSHLGIVPDDASSRRVFSGISRFSRPFIFHFTPIGSRWPTLSCGGRAVRLLASHQGGHGSIPGRVTPGFSQVGIEPDDAAGRRIFSGIFHFSSPYLIVNQQPTCGIHRHSRSGMHPQMHVTHMMNDNCDMHGIGKASVCRAVRKVTHTVNTITFSQVVDWPQDVLQVAAQFYNIAGMPHVIGCVDGTLINIDAPKDNEGQHVDRHGNHSLNCIAVCGPDCTFYYVSARWPGSVHDARVLRNSTLNERMNESWRPVPGAIILALTLVIL
ncbi:hypothetical protein PR048_006839 [Dryococelus australis]|uniref:DDE Tnp4 domain-containing protein n=1 Tax=Dryococelus australis TaxID=614101 RepID=A0ABQ9IC22_9NEOP|nr:hypothetical protein PR048_006839 [Dryococelus australis]